MMFQHQAQQLQFIQHFVDAVTIRPFFDDLRRIKQASAIFRQLPRVERQDVRPTIEAA